MTEALNESFAQRTEVWHGKEEIIRRGQEELSKVKIRYDSILDNKGPSIIINNQFVIKTYADIRNRGCSLRLITDISKANLLSSKELAKYVQLRHLDGIKGNLGIVDGVAYGATARSEEGQFPTEYVYSTVKSFVEQQQYFFDMLWNKAISAEQRIKEIEEGIKREFIETIQDHTEIQRLVPKVVKAATEEILLNFPSVNTFYRYEHEGTLQLLKETAERGVNIRILAVADRKETRHLKEKADKLFLREGSSNVKIYFLDKSLQVTILVMDELLSLMMEINDDSKKSSSDAMGLATYSNSKSTVLSHVAIFESLWIQAELKNKQVIVT
ncbi:MAG: hypothetical protein WBE68_25670 [Candidatus Nitrosopolaris sp.]